MDDRDFVDLLFQQFAKTYGAENMFWMPEKTTIHEDDFWEVYAVDQQQEKHFIGTFEGETDADFITAVHGCFPDLVRRLHDALDEADSLDKERDEAQQQHAQTLTRMLELFQELDASTSLAADNRSMADTALEAAAHWKALGQDDRQTAIDAIAERDELRAELHVVREERNTARAENSYHRPLG